MPHRSKWQSLPTEAINPSSLDLDQLSASQLVGLMLTEDRKMLEAVQREHSRVALGIEMAAESLLKGGRLIFVGAGTSGRLGLLESTEMPPSFSTDPDLVQALIAGGKSAAFKSKEGVEDSFEDGSRAMARLHPTRKDAVVGVSASGMTQFVRGALTRARGAGARIVFVTCDPACELQTFVDLAIAPDVGPEVIAGSTRLKAGTATKLVLNMLTTGAMVRIGKTYGNLMVDVETGSNKRRDRASRIITAITGLDHDEAEKLLKRAHWNVKAAIVMERVHLSYTKALVKLRQAGDSMRQALGEDAGPRIQEFIADDGESPAEPASRKP